MQCAHCDIVLTDPPYVQDGKAYCCERCFRAHARLEEAHAERSRAEEQLIEALVRALDAREGEAANHEHYDGGGYPRSLAAEVIPIGARLFAVADALDAITTDRPYHRAEPFEAALRYLAQEAGRRFDPRIVRIVEQHRLAIQRLMARLTGQINVSLDPTAIEQDVRHAAGLEAAAARA